MLCKWANAVLVLTLGGTAPWSVQVEERAPALLPVSIASVNVDDNSLRLWYSPL